MVPVERIELPTFGLQNRCSTAELNRRIEAIGARWKNIRPHGSGLRRLEYQTCPQRARTSVRPSQGVPDMKKGDLPAAFRAQFSLLYWQICCRPSSPRNKVPGMQTNPLRRA